VSAKLFCGARAATFVVELPRGRRRADLGGRVPGLGRGTRNDASAGNATARFQGMARPTKQRVEDGSSARASDYYTRDLFLDVRIRVLGRRSADPGGGEVGA
jgi:hypothetical protein